MRQSPWVADDGAKHGQMIPSEIKFDGNATPPQWTDNGDQIIEKDTKIRIKIKGLRVEMGTMYAIATIKEVSSQHWPRFGERLTSQCVGLPWVSLSSNTNVSTTNYALDLCLEMVYEPSKSPIPATIRKETPRALCAHGFQQNERLPAWVGSSLEKSCFVMTADS